MASSSCTEEELSMCEIVIIGFITLQKGGQKHTGETRKIRISCKRLFVSVIQLNGETYILYAHYMQSEIFQAFICSNFDDYGLQLMKTSNSSPFCMSYCPNATSMRLKAAVEASWSSITPQQCHRLIASMPRHIEAVIHAKGA